MSFQAVQRIALATTVRRSGLDTVQQRNSWAGPPTSILGERSTR